MTRSNILSRIGYGLLSRCFPVLTACQDMVSRRKETQDVQIFLPGNLAATPSTLQVTLPRGILVRQAVDIVLEATATVFGDGCCLKQEQHGTRWDGSRTGESWSLRENRAVEEVRWWKEDEVAGFTDRQFVPLVLPRLVA